jgi:hypothetical protein
MEFKTGMLLSTKQGMEKLQNIIPRRIIKKT